MASFSRLFGDSIEQELLSLYSRLLQETAGFSPSQARQMTLEAIELCKQNGVREGTSEFGPGFGTHLRKTAVAGDPGASAFVSVATNEGATLDDIEEFWNLHDLQRQMAAWSETIFRKVAFKTFVKEGHTESEADRRVRMMYPIYGDPRGTSLTSGPDRPLPPDIRARVDRYNERYGAQAITAQVRSFSSYNAFIRAQMTAGKL